ncbi:extracellular catalytic domain type 1 short-chain-length polyhydroxyalkanoate depolymerase [Actinokineospora sp. 24-640]
MRARKSIWLAIVAALVVSGLTVTPAPRASAAALTEVLAFGSNPSGMRMHLYVPDLRPTNPGVVVAMHMCGSSGPDFHASSEFASLADRHGFIVIYPSAQQDVGFGKCFDTWSAASKLRGSGSDPVSILSMVNHVKLNHAANPAKIYATGSSSGGVMTNHLTALYPDVFAAGSAFMGVPVGCFLNAADFLPGTSTCTSGTGANRTPLQWGDAVRQAYPGYGGTRPPMQLWHGTADTLLPPPLLEESIEQWTNVFGLSQTPTSSDTPQTNWNRRRYGSTTRVEAYSIQGAGHTLPSAGMAAHALKFFGLASCQVASTVTSWNGGLTTSITITNTGPTTVNSWDLGFTLPAGQNITGGWNATYTPSSGRVIARNESHNAAIGPGSATSIGFQGTHTGNAGNPTSFTMNGVPCTSI